VVKGSSPFTRAVNNGEGFEVGMQVQLDQMIFMFLIPYGIWLTVSMFNQRQELALLRQTLEDLANAFKEFKEVACHNCRRNKKDE
jgi:hypothetical protein